MARVSSRACWRSITSAIPDSFVSAKSTRRDRSNVTVSHFELRRANPERQDPRDLVELFRDDVPPHPTSTFFDFDETGFGKNSGVVRDRRLTLGERSLEGAAAHFGLRGDQGEHPQAYGIAECPKYRRRAQSL